MASNIGKYIVGSRTKHSVGTVTSFLPIRTVTNGAKVTETGGVYNFAMVELAYVDGVPTVKYATALATAANVFLTVTPENVLESYGEKICDFFNDKDELATVAYLEKGLTFETSRFTSPTTAAVGDFAIWDATTKAFIVKAIPEVTDIKVFQIQSIEADEKYNIDNLTLVELVVIR